MRVRYKGYLLAADKSWEKPGEVIGAIFKLPSLDSAFDGYFSVPRGEVIKALKEKINKKEVT